MANGSKRAAIVMGWLKDIGGFVAMVGVLAGLAYYFHDSLADRIDAVDAKLAEKIDAVDAKLTGKIDAVDAKLTGKIDAVDEKLAGRIDAVDEKLTGRIDAVDARVGRLEDRLSNDIRALEERLRRSAGGFDARYAGAIDKWVPLPIWRLFPIQAATKPQAQDWGRTVPAAFVGDMLTLYPEDGDAEMAALLRKGGWRPADPGDPTAGLVLRGAAP